MVLGKCSFFPHFCTWRLWILQIGSRATWLKSSTLPRCWCVVRPRWVVAEASSHVVSHGCNNYIIHPLTMRRSLMKGLTYSMRTGSTGTGMTGTRHLWTPLATLLPNTPHHLMPIRGEATPKLLSHNLRPKADGKTSPSKRHITPHNRHRTIHPKTQVFPPLIGGNQKMPFSAVSHQGTTEKGMALIYPGRAWLVWAGQTSLCCFKTLFPFQDEPRRTNRHQLRS